MDGILTIPLPGSTLGSSSVPKGRRDGRSGPHRFFVGPENHLVEVAVAAFFDPTQIGFNPLLLYGPTGTGKSHLAQGLAAWWNDCHGDGRIVYTTAIDLARDASEAVQTQTIDDLRAHFRCAELLIVEDIHRLAVGRPDRDRQKRLAQEELLHTIDALLARGSRIVVTSAKAPAAMSGIMPALQGRLAAGLTVPLSPPGLETRFIVLREFARQRDLPLPEAVLHTLAEGLNGTIGELEGALLQIQMTARSQCRLVDMALVREYLAQRSRPQSPSLGEIASATAEFFHLTVLDLRSSSRRRGVVSARGVAIYLTRQLTKKSLQEIGRYFGGRDHTTVMHSYRKTNDLLRTDPAVRQAVERLQQKWEVR